MPCFPVMDLRGMQNPEAIVALAQAAQQWDEGQTVRVLSDDACFGSDFVRWAGGSDVEVLSLHFPAKNLTEVILRQPKTLRHRIRA